MKLMSIQFFVLFAVALCVSFKLLYQAIGFIKSTKNYGLRQEMNEDKSYFLQHVTILVSDIEKAKSWYTKVLPLSEIERNIKTAVRGAWYNLNGIELHLLEKKDDDLAGTKLGRITGQHIGLHLGPIGEIRDKLYEQRIPVTLAPENDKAQQAMFVTDGDLMTWEFTDVNKKDKPMELVQSKTTLSTAKSNMHLDRPSASTTTKGKVPEYPFKFAISSGNPIATAAGHACLQIGGSAADATICTAAVLSVVEPFNGGLGGDFIAMIHDPRADKDVVLNGSGRSPKNSKPLSEYDTMTDGAKSAMSIPGTAAAWCKLHEEYGKLPWKIVLQPAIMLAAEGFLISERTAQVWESGAKRIFDSSLETEAKEEFMSIFAPPSSDGKRMTPRANERFYNPTLGFTYQKFADGGCEWFYQEAAKDIVGHVQRHGGYEGSPDLRKNWSETKEDHAAWEEPLSTTFSTNGKEFKVMTAGGNSQAGAALMILNALDTTLPFSEQRDPETFNEVLHKHISAKRIIFRDTFRKSFTQNKIDDIKYIENARQEIKDAFRKRVSVSMEKAPVEESHDTEGFVVRDSYGLTLSVLQSNALPFGSGVTVPSLGITIHNRASGFTTNQSDEFSFGPGKRPWTTLSPYMVRKDGKFWMAASVKGGDRQPYAFSQVFLNIAHNQMNPADAVLHPRFRDKSHVRKDAVLEFDLPPYVPNDAMVNMTEFQQLREYLESNGYGNKVYEPLEIEDSGFGLAQILIDESPHLNKEYTVVTDAGRKPGLAMTGEQLNAAQDISLRGLGPSVVHPQDLEVLIRPLKEFFSNRNSRMEKYDQYTIMS